VNEIAKIAIVYCLCHAAAFSFYRPTLVISYLTKLAFFCTFYFLMIENIEIKKGRKRKEKKNNLFTGFRFFRTTLRQNEAKR
jgi:hypothetical protein